MELGLSLGDSSKSKSFGCRANACREIKTVTATATATVTATAAAAAKDLGLCMALGINPCGVGGGSGTSDQERKQKQVLVHQDDGYEEDEEEEEDEDGTDQEEADENSIVQLDLLPRAPVPRRTPWSSGSSEGGSSGNKGLDVNRRPATVTALATEEATSSFRMDMGMYRRSGGKRDLEGNDAVEAERASSRASDEDENGLSRKKLRLSKEQSAYLEESFKEHNTLNPKQKQALAKQLNLRPRQVEVWFQNRRARTKLKQTEVDCEYLKRCCETLTEENRRLQKELQELRALKSSSNNPFYMQLPATTLTMCPSCERVATSTTAAVPPPPPTPSTTTTTPNFPLSTTSNNKPRSFFPFSNPKTTPT